MQLIDSHCHLNLLVNVGDNREVITNARKSGIIALLNVSVDLETLPDVLSPTRQFDNVYASVGVHPNSSEVQEPTIEDLVTLATDQKIIAIGETGLDYYRSEGDLEWQRDRFRRHIAAAKRAGKPLIIHTRDAWEDTLRIMKEEKADIAGGVMHCFTGDWEMAQSAIELGFYISFSGIVTFKNAQQLKEVAQQMPADRILVETDSPYLAPVPYRGKPNQPAYVRYVAECIASLRGSTIDQLGDLTTENFYRLFKSIITIPNNILK